MKTIITVMLTIIDDNTNNSDDTTDNGNDINVSNGVNNYNICTHSCRRRIIMQIKEK